MNDGGSIFPDKRIKQTTYPGEDKVEHDQTTGLTIRDYFASQAMNALICSFDRQDKEEWTKVLKMSRERIAQQFAYDAYEIADAMIAQRSRPSPTTGGSK